MDKIQHVMHHFSSALPSFTVNICAWCSSNRGTHCSATVEDTATLSEVSLSFHRWFRPHVTARSVPSNHTLVHEAASSRWEDTMSNSSQQQRWPPGDGRRKDSFYSNLVTDMIMCVFFYLSLSLWRKNRHQKWVLLLKQASHFVYCESWVGGVFLILLLLLSLSLSVFL